MEKSNFDGARILADYYCHDRFVVVSPLNERMIPCLVQLVEDRKDLVDPEDEAYYRSFIERYQADVVRGDYQCG